MAKIVVRETDLRALEYARHELGLLLAGLKNHAEREGGATKDGKKAMKELADAQERLIGLIDRYNAASLPKVKATIPYQQLVTLANSYLPSRLILPPPGATGVVAQVVRRVADLGLTEALWVKACIAAAKSWKGPVRLESIARQADKLLSDVDSYEAKAEVPAAGEWNDLGG